MNRQRYHLIRQLNRQISDLEHELQEKRDQLQVLLQNLPRPGNLPNEMLEAILQWITDPVDQVHVVQAFSMIGPLMNWDEGTLYFQLIYPHVAPYLWKDWRDAWRLCQVSPDFRHVIVEHLRSRLSGSSSDLVLQQYSTQSQLDRLVTSCNELGRAKWMRDTPFLVSIKLPLMRSAEDNQNGNPLDLPDYVNIFLDGHGDRVWDCELALDSGSYTEHQLHGILHGILSRMPHLISLRVNDLHGNSDWEDLLLPQPLPDLPRLRCLETTSQRSATSGPYDLFFIRQYGPQVTTLKTAHWPPVPQQGGRYPLLENYSAWWYRAFPTSVLAAPLRSVSLELNAPTYTPEALKILTHFEKSLEKVTLHYHSTMTREKACPLDMEMSEMRLPNLRHLELLFTLGIIDGLMAFPALETLRFYRAIEEASRGQLYLTPSPGDRATLSTNVWRHMQNLKQMEICWEEKDGWRWVSYRCPGKKIRGNAVIRKADAGLGLGGGLAMMILLMLLYIFWAPWQSHRDK